MTLDEASTWVPYTTPEGCGAADTFAEVFSSAGLAGEAASFAGAFFSTSGAGAGAGSARGVSLIFKLLS